MAEIREETKKVFLGTIHTFYHGSTELGMAFKHTWKSASVRGEIYKGDSESTFQVNDLEDAKRCILKAHGLNSQAKRQRDMFRPIG